MGVITEDKNETKNRKNDDTKYPYWTWNAPYYLVYSRADLVFQTTDWDVLQMTFALLKNKNVQNNKVEV